MKSRMGTKDPKKRRRSVPLFAEPSPAKAFRATRRPPDGEIGDVTKRGRFLFDALRPRMYRGGNGRPLSAHGAARMEPQDRPAVASPPPGSPRLLDRVRSAVRVRHYSLRTEECYAAWIRRFILFHGKRHPLEMGAAEINAFLTHLAVEGRVSASTQNQAFSALLFLYQKVLEVDPGRISGVVRREPAEALPVVLSPDEVRRALAQAGRNLSVDRLVTVRLGIAAERVPGVARAGRGPGASGVAGPPRQGRQGPADDDSRGAGRRPAAAAGTGRALHRRERERGRGQVRLPDAMDRKAPTATTAWAWQWLFPSATISPTRAATSWDATMRTRGR